MTNQNKTPLQDALEVVYEVLRAMPDDKMLIVYKAAQAFSDLPEEIEGFRETECSMDNRAYTIGYNQALDDVLNLLETEGDNDKR